MELSFCTTDCCGLTKDGSDIILTCRVHFCLFSALKSPISLETHSQGQNPGLILLPAAKEESGGRANPSDALLPRPSTKWRGWGVQQKVGYGHRKAHMERT